MVSKTVNPPVDVKKRTILSTGGCGKGMVRSQYQEVNRENSRKETFIPFQPRPPTFLVHIHLSFSSYIFISSKRFSVVYFQVRLQKATYNIRF